MKKRIHLGDLETDLSKGISGPMAEEEGGDEDQRKDRERDQGEFSVEVKKKYDDPDQQKDIFEKVDENGGEHFVDVLDIVGQSRD